ncbi:hypothetical protein N7495_009919 [Penicillium taxi]|uniref:uncharacterized protein n=1 Tax=Penicillium taxi TaxID=168475 RepID=UPI002545960C|nr:uncharacterized protein N7495_009919 [Penicillium taxi]KAJ5885409.1 hypothetical protein N7495_009919 [Penicillium taxi]
MLPINIPRPWILDMKSGEMDETGTQMQVTSLVSVQGSTTDLQLAASDDPDGHMKTRVAGSVPTSSSLGGFFR